METRRPEDRAARARLSAARVLIIGAGGLGSPAALALAAAGVGSLVLLDPDVVEISNLQRQLLHRTSALGQDKVDSARRRIAAIDPAVRVEAHRQALDAANAHDFFSGADFVIDATDGVAAKFLINDAAVLSGRAYSHAGILGFTGQTMTVLPRQSACLRCLFAEPPDAESIASCQEAGILGAVAGVIGALQAAEAIKYLLACGELLTDRLFTYDAHTQHMRTIAIARRRACRLCGDQPSITNLGSAKPSSMGVCV